MPVDVHVAGFAQAVVAGSTGKGCVLVEVLAHLHGGAHHFHAYGKGKMIVELVGDAGIDGVRDELHALQVVPAGPFVGVLHAQTETGEGGEAEPHLVVDLMGEVEGRNGPGLMSAVEVARVVACAVAGIHAPVELRNGKVGLHLRSVKERHGRRVVGKGGGVAAAGDETAGKAHAPGAVLHDGKAFSEGAAGRNKEGKGNEQAERTESAHTHGKTVHHITPAAEMQKSGPTRPEAMDER